MHLLRPLELLRTPLVCVEILVAETLEATTQGENIMSTLHDKILGISIMFQESQPGSSDVPEIRP